LIVRLLFLTRKDSVKAGPQAGPPFTASIVKAAAI
jgi:hypothetical protein